MSTQSTNEIQQPPSGPDGGGPNWLGWFVILAVVVIMIVAVALSVQQMQEEPIATAPTPFPQPRIGSIEVPSQEDPSAGPSTEHAGEEPDASVVSGDFAESASEEEALADGAESAVAGATGTLHIAEETVETIDRELLVPAPVIIVVAPTPASVAGLAFVPTATAVTQTSDAASDSGAAPSATGRVQTRGRVTSTVQAPPEEAVTTPVDTASRTLAPTEPPPVTTTPAPIPTQTPMATETALPTLTPTDTPMPTETPSATPTVTPTQTPTAVSTATPTATEIGPPTATPTIRIEDLPVQVPPGGKVVARFSLLMRLDASPSAGVMETYATGAAFDVLEPVDPFDSYPVNVGDIAWLRVRAEDGLVGWINASHVSIED